jgi:hypothetical protein
MFVVVYTAHAKSPHDARVICASFNVDLELVQMPGYLQGACAIGVTDPCAVISLQFWGTQSARDFALVSESSRRAIAEVGAHLDGPYATAVYKIV